MKYRDKNGNVYNNIVKAKLVYCMGRECEECVFGEQPSCTLFALDNFAEAARLMGYEVVEDEKEENMKPKKPLKDWALEEAQAFCKQQKRCNNCTMRKREIAVCKMAGPACKWDLTDPTRFTDQEIEAAKAILTLWPEATHVERVDAYIPRIRALVEIDEAGTFDVKVFPSLRPGETARLKDILGEQAKGGA